MKQPIITDIDKLSNRCEEFDVRKQGVVARGTIIDLKDTLRELTGFHGISAPLIDTNLRIIVMNYSGDMKSYCNPIITGTDGFSLSREKCAALPGREFLAPRYTKISIAYQTPMGKLESCELVGLSAQIFQHEIDHLEGLLLSDFALEIDESYDKATEDERAELIKFYLDQLQVKYTEVEKEIAEDKELKELNDGIKFVQAVSRGEVTLAPYNKKTDKVELVN